MNAFTDYIDQRLEFARDLLASGDIRRALSICEQLLSPASLATHGKEIFTLIASSLDSIGETIQADMIRNRIQELFDDETIGQISTDRAQAIVNDVLPLLTFPDDEPFQQIMYDDIWIQFPSIVLDSISRQNEEPQSGETSKTLSALEELARRLEHATIPVLDEERTIVSPSFMPSVVTETMAHIYVQQGAYTQAIKAYQVLARNNPERLEYFESLIAELRLRQS